MTLQPTSQTGDTLAEAVTPEAAFGLRLRQARERQGISLREMARRLTRSHSNLWDYERGHRLATVEVAGEYERELGLAIGEFQEPLETARRAVYGEHRDRRRPFRPPAAAPAPVPIGSPDRAPSARTPPELPRSHSRPPTPFVGRDEPMAAARGWLDEAAAGEPRIILLRGDGGIGKSALLAHLLATAREGGWLGLCGFCLQGARLAYLPLASALAPLRADGQVLPGVPASLANLFADGLPTGAGNSVSGDETDAAADRRHLNLVVAAAQAMLDAANERPLILAIEDLHWADDSTLGFLELLAAVATQKSTLTPVPLAVVLTTRPTREGETAWRLTQRLKREVTCRDIELTGLDQLEINQIVTELVKARPSPRLLHSVSEASSGNPLLLRSLLDRLIADGTIGVEKGVLSGPDLPLPAVALELDAELGTRLERTDDRGADLLGWAAILGDGQSLMTLQTISGCDDAEFDRLMGRAGSLRLLYEEGDIYRFDHPELREVLYARLSGRQRRRRHLAAARCLEEESARGSQELDVPIAYHLSLAGPDAPGIELARRARGAADRSFALAAWSDAGTYYDLCLVADQSTASDPALLGRAGVAHFRNHDHHRAEDRLLRAVEAARAAGDEAAWGRAALALTKSRVTGGSWLGAAVDLEPLQEFLRASSEGAADLRARAYSLLSDAHFAQFDFPAGFEQATRALEAASGVDDHEVAAEVELALGIQHLAALHLHEAEQRLLSCQQHASELADPWASSWAASRLPLVRWCQGDLAGAERVATGAAELAMAHFDWAEASLATACRVNVAVAQGRLADAERLGTLAVQQYLRSDYLWTVLIVAPALIAGRAFRGDAKRASEAIEMLSGAGVDTEAFRLAVAALAGELEGPSAGSPGEPDQAAPSPRAPYNLFDLATAALQVEVVEVTGDPDLARAAAGPLEAAQAAGFGQVIGWVASVPRLLGVVNACLGRDQEAESWLHRALLESDRVAETESARTRLNLAQLLVARGATAAAVTQVNEAARTFRRLGLTALEARSEQLQRRLARPGS